jgi:hypothetical protein
MLQIEQAAKDSMNRLDLSCRIINGIGATTVAEIGVWRGEFSEYALKNCPGIKRYYMLDSWRRLDDWNKPFNVSDEQFTAVMSESLERTEFAADKRVVLRGTTVEKADDLSERGLDYCYIDGDHTLRGILIDLVRLYAKVRDGGVLGGDDFVPAAWQHGWRFEPTLVFPTAVHFAEATGSVIYGLPHAQFAIVVDRTRHDFEFRDLTGSYVDRTLLAVLRHRPENLAKRIFRSLREMLSS